MDEFKNMSEEERLEAENDFLKMKMMLERGAEFERAEEGLPADIENQFLRNVLEFEKQFDQRKVIKIYDKIGRPTQFKPVAEIPDESIKDEWLRLHDFMLGYGVELSAISPGVTAGELYRFATEELFEHETDDINIPGMISGFIYDEFHPDYIYENTRTAIEDCIQAILNKNSIDFMTHFAKDNLCLNNHQKLTEDSFKEIINRFKNAYDSIELLSADPINCTIEETNCIVNGNFTAKATFDHEREEWNNSWEVQFHFEDDFGYWYITRVQIEGINF